MKDNPYAAIAEALTKLSSPSDSKHKGGYTIPVEITTRLSDGKILKAEVKPAIKWGRL